MCSERTKNEGLYNVNGALLPTGLLIGTVMIGMTAAYAALCYYAAKREKQITDDR